MLFFPSVNEGPLEKTNDKVIPGCFELLNLPSKLLYYFTLSILSGLK